MEVSTMTKRDGSIFRLAAVAAGAAFAVATTAFADGMTSGPTFVSLRPGESSFWMTATNSTMSLPVDFPAGAHSATLRISADGYAFTSDPVVPPATEVVVTLPDPHSPGEENVYDLELSFDDGTVRAAKLGLIQGLAPGGEGATRCVMPKDGVTWNKFFGRAVLPVPFGVSTITVNGQPVDAGLGGAQGWYALCGYSVGDAVSLGMSYGGEDWLADLVCHGVGLMIFFR
jgi:hypothetical protein